MKTLIIGAGEVGKALKEVVEGAHETFIRDIEGIDSTGFEVIHICYPDSEKFVQITNKYIDQYKPKLTIINSSVRVGTTNKFGNHVVYSPVRGRHPHIANEMRFFTKYVAGYDREKVRKAEEYFVQCGLGVSLSDSPVTLELSKLISNIHLGIEIAWRQEVERIFSYFNAKVETYQDWERTYADGYILLNQKQLMRPQLSPNPIGGHCVLECTEILSQDYPSKIFDFVVDSNTRVKNDLNQRKVSNL